MGKANFLLTPPTNDLLRGDLTSGYERLIIRLISRYSRLLFPEGGPLESSNYEQAYPFCQNSREMLCRNRDLDLNYPQKRTNPQ